MNPVAGKLPNVFRLHDMSGNIFEFCNASLFDYKGEKQTDPISSTSRSWGWEPYYIVGFRTFRPIK
jgi:formylglycine-generating enzyme required for sulfatase activity